MDTNEILNTVNEIFRRVLDDKDIVLKNETVAADVAKWDSLNHYQLILAVEKHFDIKFTTLEIMGFKNVGDICQRIKKKLLK